MYCRGICWIMNLCVYLQCLGGKFVCTDPDCCPGFACPALPRENHKRLEKEKQTGLNHMKKDFFYNLNVPIWMFVWVFFMQVYIFLLYTVASCSSWPHLWLLCQWFGPCMSGMCCWLLLAGWDRTLYPLKNMYRECASVDCLYKNKQTFVFIYVSSFSRQEVTSDRDTQDSCLHSLFSWSFLAL